MFARSVPRLVFLVLSIAPCSVGAQTLVPWPSSGSPLCTTPGDQFSLSSALGVRWLERAGVADTVHWGGTGVTPPMGDCLSNPTPVAPGVVPGSFSMSWFETGICLGCPGCGCLRDLAQTWVSRDLNNDHVAINVFGWLSAASTVVVRTADAGALSSPRAAANATSIPLDSAAIVVWAEQSGPGSQVRAQRVTQHGALEWSAPDGIVISATGAEPSVMRLETTGDGATLIVWLDHRGASADIYALRLLPDGTPAPGWPAGGLALEDRSEDSARPRLVQGNSSFYVVWEESGARFGGGKSIVARRILPSGLADPQWPDSGVVVTSSTTVDRLEDVAEELLIVWSDMRDASPGNPNDLYAQSLESNGVRAAGWPAGGAALSTAPGSQDHARIGGGLFAWEDRRSGESKVYVTRLDASGQVPCCSWAPDGSPAAQAIGEQRNPALIGGLHATYVVWEDGRDLANNGMDIYEQAFQLYGALGTIVGVDPDLHADRVEFRRPRPNPTSGVTQLRLDLPQAAHVRLCVYDVVGRLVRILADDASPAGPREWIWRGDDHSGRLAPPGLYHVRALIDGTPQSRSVVLIH